jgi:hypothetical protein
LPEADWPFRRIFAFAEGGNHYLPALRTDADKFAEIPVSVCWQAQ